MQVSISYPGATPEDVEQSLLLPVEAAIADVEGIDELTATASEGSASVNATLIDGVDVMRAYQDIQQAVNAITTLPSAADPPRFTLAGRSRSVLSLQVYGPVGLEALHNAAEDVRGELQATPGISRAELSGNREREIQVHLDEEAIERYGLDHQELASRIAEEALDLASGQLTTAEGEWLIRYQGRRNSAEAFAELPILTSTQGRRLPWARSPGSAMALPKPTARSFITANPASPWMFTRLVIKPRPVFHKRSTVSLNDCVQVCRKALVWTFPATAQRFTKTASAYC
ncbi:hypothetical protein HORIV_52810 [Vreelandella olivaria]|uniref:Uncharacterized protein n=1 Tax=Vreelandella olivaria TaxID=390919 RepID=A0ABN5X2J6_9GAMM|nr:hypothetical protein HORIV_52810 [Halomonas olivaria]